MHVMAVDKDTAATQVSASPQLPGHSARQSQAETKPFPYTRARVVMLAIMFCYVTNSYSVSPIQAQYLHHRFTPDFFNDTTTNHSASGKLTSNCDNNVSSWAKQESALQKHVAEVQMYLSYADIGPMVIATVVFGSLSDVFGRRLVFLLPCVSAFLKQVIYLTAMKLDLPLWLFFVANVVDGLSGSFCTLFLASFAYTADITHSAKSRTIGITLAESCLVLGAVASHLAVGYLLQEFGFFYGNLFPTAFAGCSVLIGMFCLPETVSARDEDASSGCVNPFKYLKNVFGFYLFNGSTRERCQFCLGLLVIFIVMTSIIAHVGVFTLYQLNRPFCWSPQQVGQYGAMSLGIKAVLGIPVVHVLQKGLSDPVIVALGITSYVAQFILEGLAQNDAMLYLAMAAGGISSLAVSVSRSFMSKLAGTDKQGALFASIAVAETVSTLVSSTLYNSIYGATVATMRGAVFLVMAALLGADLCLVMLLRYMQTPDKVFEISNGKTTSTETTPKKANQNKF